ncbi:recombinase zinc beta ribbon domain-containing protein [Taibaiella helva]|uniref:recombinase zinc beta ribbon domain-containing protein n=1 Tax=Taibaiella helva TaxID=2301235 RepID=UPI003742237C
MLIFHRNLRHPLDQYLTTCLYFEDFYLLIIKVSEIDFWNAQHLLRNIKPTKVQPKEEFPLRGLIKCWCGQHMTAGFSKGKKKYYLYYRCIHHTEKNYRGEAMHDQFAELLGAISFFRLTRLNISPRKPDLFLRILKRI